MKNKGMIISFALIVLSLVGISVHGGPLTYVFFFASVFIPAMSFIYILCVMHSLKIFQKTDGRDMVADTPTDFYITLHNEGWFSFSSVRISFYSSFSGISEIEEDVTYELPPHSSITKKTKLLCYYRGEYKVGIKQITLKDYLGIFTVTYRIKEPLNVIVAPVIRRIDEAGGKETFSDANRQNMIKRTEPDIPVREYMDGDDIRFINHKASAAMQKYMVREKCGEEKNSIAIVLDGARRFEDEREYLPMENKAIEHVLSISLFYMENNVPVEVILKDVNEERYPVSDMSDFDILYDKLTTFRFRKEEGLDKISGLFGYRMIVFVLQKLTDRDEECIKMINSDRVPERIYLTGFDGEESYGS